jgi:hypothetical protein
MLGIKDVDYDILNKLDDKSLVAFCQVNKNANSTCNDDRYWESRVLSRLNLFYLPYIDILKYKGNRTWYEYYINDLSSVAISRLNPNKTVDQDRLDQIMAYINSRYLVDHGQPEIGLDEYAITFNFIRYAIDKASAKGYIKIVRYLLSLNVLPLSYLTPSMLAAAKNGHLDIVILFENYGVDIHRGIVPDQVLLVASRHNRDDVVQYLLSRGSNPDKLWENLIN